MPSVLIIGAGFGGIGTAVELRRAGFSDVTALERGDAIGGVWRENTYPGVGCDIPSPYYSFSHSPNRSWPLCFSPGPEILAHLSRTAAAHGVTPRYGVTATAAEFRDGRWHVTTSAGEFVADVLVYRPWQHRLFPVERAFFWCLLEVCAFGITGNRLVGRALVDGTLHEADVLVYGTGFRATDFLSSLHLRGVSEDLSEAWSRGASAYLRMTVPGFPNMFLVYGPNTNLGSGSIVYMLERQARYIRQAVTLLTDGLSTLDVRPEVARRFDDEVQRRLAGTVWTSCANWYRTPSHRITTNWPGLVTEYHRRTRILTRSDYVVTA
jgi:cation diffusion facilitator CzcD-associated flavoprotein CzcO